MNVRSGPAVARNEVAFWSVVLAFFVTMLGTTLPTPLYLLYQQRLGFSTATSTVIFAAYGFGVLAALVLFGRASDVIGQRRALLFGLACSALSALVFLGAHNIGCLIVGRLLSGVSAGVFTGTASATLVDLAGNGRSERATLAATVANMGGLGCGPLLAGLLVKLAPAPLLLPFAVDLALVFVVSIGVSGMPKPVAHAASPRYRLLLPRLPVAVRTTFMRASFACFAGFAVLGLFAAVSPIILSGTLGLHDPALSGAAVCTLLAASTLGQIAVVRTLGRSALRTGCRVLSIDVTMLALGLWTKSVFLLVAATILAGLGQGINLRAGLGAINQEVPSSHRIEVISTFFLVVYVAISVPVIGMGLASDVWGLREAGIGFSIAVAALAAVASCFQPSETHRVNAARPRCLRESTREASSRAGTATHDA